MDNQKSMEVFIKAPVSQAVFKNALPAIAAMLMVLVYNLADTFFIGQTHDALQVAAVSLATPVFLMFMAVGTAFGIGGTSVISRALGEGKKEYAKKVCSFCMWSCIVVGVVMAALFLIFLKPILSLIGASSDTWDLSKTYLSIVACSGPFVLISNCYANIIRAEGEAGKAMMGQLLGNLLNFILDPVMILGFGWNIAGAAIATVIGNLFGAGYYIFYFLRGKSILSINIKDFTLKDKVCSNVLVIGIPAALGSLLMSVSQIIINSQMAEYGDMAIAGMGVAMKVVIIAGMVCMGLGQGAFLTDVTAFDYAVSFARILLTTSFLFGVFYVLTNALQAMGAATASLIINLSRQGIIFIPALFILKTALGLNGLIWAQPVADIFSLALAAGLYINTYKKLSIQKNELPMEA